MSTHRQELLDLQAKATRAGRTALFNVDREGRIDSVFYKDPKAGANALSRTGITLGPITFAEIERTKPAVRFFPKGYTVGVTYPIGDTLTREEAGGAEFKERFAGSYMENRHFRVIPTGEKRAPKKGEWYLSGALVTGYRSPSDATAEYLIAKLVRVERVPVVETYRIVG